MDPLPPPPNGGALAWRVDRLEKDVEGIKGELREQKLDAVQVRLTDLMSDVGDVRDEMKWVKRTMIGTLITLALGALLLAFNLAAGGIH